MCVATLFMFLCNVFHFRFKQDSSRPLILPIIAIASVLAVFSEYITFWDLKSQVWTDRRQIFVLATAFITLALKLTFGFLFFSDAISPEHYRSFLTSALFLNIFESLYHSYIYASTCIDNQKNEGKGWRRISFYLKHFLSSLRGSLPWHSRSLWMGSVVYGAISLLSMLFLILAILFELQWISFATLYVAIFSLTRVSMVIVNSHYRKGRKESKEALSPGPATTQPSEARDSKTALNPSDPYCPAIGDNRSERLSVNNEELVYGGVV